MADSVRIDKWLWSVRLFKTRTQATNACKSGKISINENTAKPSSLVQVDNVVQVKRSGFEFQFLVRKIISKRVGAALAQPCYVDQTPQSELNKYTDWFSRKAPAERREKGAGRPTKHERRRIDAFKDFYFDDFEDLD